MVKILRTHRFLIILLLPILLSCEYLLDLYDRNADTIYRHNKRQLQLCLQWHPTGTLKLIVVGVCVPWKTANAKSRLDLFFVVACLDQGLENYGLRSGQLFLKIQFYWNTAMPIHFWIVCGSFPIFMTELSHCNRDEYVTSLKYLLSSPLKKFVNLWSRLKKATKEMLIM